MSNVKPSRGNTGLGIKHPRYKQVANRWMHHVTGALRVLSSWCLQGQRKSLGHGTILNRLFVTNYSILYILYCINGLSGINKWKAWSIINQFQRKGRILHTSFPQKILDRFFLPFKFKYCPCPLRPTSACPAATCVNVADTQMVLRTASLHNFLHFKMYVYFRSWQERSPNSRVQTHQLLGARASVVSMHHWKAKKLHSLLMNDVQISSVTHFIDNVLSWDALGYLHCDRTVRYYESCSHGKNSKCHFYI